SPTYFCWSSCSRLRSASGLSTARCLSSSAAKAVSSFSFFLSSFCFLVLSDSSFFLAFLPTAVSLSVRWRSTYAIFMPAGAAASARRTPAATSASPRKTSTHVLLIDFSNATRVDLEEIPDRELEDQRILARLTIKGDTPFEPQRADRREPAEAKADRVPEALGQ